MRRLGAFLAVPPCFRGSMLILYRSVLGRLLNSSLWPSILRTDSVTHRGVSKKVVLLSALSTLGSLLLAIVGPVTPLGLSTRVQSSSAGLVRFKYAIDNSPIGQLKISRTDYVNNRLCGAFVLLNCPGSYAGYNTISNATGEYAIPDGPDAYMSSAIAPNITEAFTSATNSSRTISSVFDIQYRLFTVWESTKSNETQWIDQGRPQTRGQFQYFQSFILDDRYEAVEGLIVDTKAGGIGFRNHSMPPSSDTGYEWTEDILWIEPDTVCVNTNLTLDFTTALSIGAISANLTDRGGFVNLPKDYPYLDLNHSQMDPMLYARAWKGAVLSNLNLLIYFNQTRGHSYIGKKYGIGDTFLDLISPNQLSVQQFSDGTILMPTPLSFDTNSYNFSNPNAVPKYLDISTCDQSWVQSIDFADIWSPGTVVSGFGGADNVSIETISVIGGLILGTGIQVDESGNPLNGLPSVQINPLANWSRPLFSCATALRASVKRITFNSNSTSVLSNLNIVNIEAISYASNDTIPIWAVEKPSLRIGDINPFWGIVSDKYASSASLMTIQKESFYLPASSSSIWGISSVDSSAGADAPGGVLEAVYSPMFIGMPDYSGTTNWALFLKWQSLSRSASTAGSIINLMWTDLMANAVVGAKGLFSDTDNTALEETGSATAVATPLKDAIHYDFVYAIPAFVYFALYGATLTFAILLFVLGRVRIGMLRALLNHTSAGRAAIMERYPSEDRVLAKTSEWTRAFGQENVLFKKSQARHKASIPVKGGGHNPPLPQNKGPAVTELHKSDRRGPQSPHTQVRETSMSTSNS